MKKTVLSLLLAVCLLLSCAPLAFADGPTFSDPASAAAYLKEHMLAREPEIEFSYLAAKDAVGELNRASLSAYFSEAWDAIEANVFAHTGVGSEGDYLLHNLGEHGYQYGVSYSSMDTEVTYSVTATADYYTTAAQEKQVTDAVAKALAGLDLTGKSDYEKVRAITDYICENTEYDYVHLNDDTYDLKYSTYAALINGTSVCQGYATLFYRMALEAGLDCRVISGVANNGKATEAHAWNIVRVSGKYYQHDVTWIDGTGDDRYFLKGRNGFADHASDAEYDTDAFKALYPIATADYDAKNEQECVHQWDNGTVTKAATCKETGEVTYICILCHAAKTEQLPKTESHSWNNGVVTTPATCTADGVKTFTCAVCKETKTEPVKATGHQPVTDKAVAATCTKDGKTEGSHCAVCGEVLTAQKTVKATGHQWDNGKITTAPTCVEDGVKTFTCTVCDQQKTEKAAATGEHAFSEWTVTKEATADEDGEESRLCAVCLTKETRAIPKLTPTEPEQPTKPDYTPGDVDGDGKITSADARLALRRSVMLEDYPEGSAAYLACDVDHDGKVTSADARLILRGSVGLEDVTLW